MGWVALSSECVGLIFLGSKVSVLDSPLVTSPSGYRGLELCLCSPDSSFYRLVPSALDPRTFFSPLDWSCFVKVAGSLDPGRQACVTCVTFTPLRPRQWRREQLFPSRAVELLKPMSLKDELFSGTGEGRRGSGVTSVLVL